MKIDNIGQVLELHYLLKQAFGEIPENIYIECHEIYNDAKENLGMTEDQVRGELEIYGIKVEKEFSRIY